MYRILCTVKRFQEDMAKFYAAQLVIAVGHLHERGFMHRDLKLENIMMDESGYIKIIDFGLAKIIVSDEFSYTQCGTPEYFAPEIILDQGYDLKVDWWAVGILIYELVFGKTPFRDNNRHRML